MRCFARVLSTLVLVVGLTCSCNSTVNPINITPIANEEVVLKQNDAMVNGGVYVYTDDRLFNVLEMEWTYPSETPLFDKAILSPDEWISIAENDSKSYILTVTVEGYSEQGNYGKVGSTNMLDYLLTTNCRIDKIHYLGDEILLQEGKVYNFEHIGYWVLNQNDSYVYSRGEGQSMLRYGKTYIIFGSMGTNQSLSIWSDPGCTEICDKEDYEQFRTRIWEIEGRAYPALCEEYLEYFTKP